MKKFPAWAILCILTLVAGLALGVTNALTEEPIAAQAEADAAKARQSVMTNADTFEAVESAPGTAVGDITILSCHKAYSGGAECGKVVVASVKGYGGVIEVAVGIAADGTITGVNCGGAGFAETPGLGAKVKEAKFTDQFAGMSAPVMIKKDGGEVDSVTAASRSSRAVCNAISAAVEYAAGVE